MKINTPLTVLVFLIFFCVSMASISGETTKYFTDEKTPLNDTLKLFVPEGWPEPVYDFSKNPITREGYELGRKLFYDPMLSEDTTISCSSCHLQYTNFTHVDHQLSHGIKGLKGTRNTIALVNTAWISSFMWDGGVNNIEVQPLAPIESPVEMNSSLKIILPRLKNSEYYQKQFKKAFGEKAEINSELFLKALSQYMLYLQSYNSKYDKVMRKEEGVSFTEGESRGYELFKTHCGSCHKEPLFTNNEFENNGLEPDTFLRDGGRIKITHQKKDSLKFRVPSLRNIEVSYPYMHDGRFRNLQMVLFHYNDGLSKTINLSPRLKKPMKLSEQNKKDIIAFLKTLTDMDYLRKAEYGFPKE